MLTKKLTKPKSDTGTCTSIMGKVKYSKAYSGMNIPAFCKISKNPKSKQLIKVVILLQSHVRGWLIRKQNLLNEMYQYHEHRDFAARVIQSYWRSFVDEYYEVETLIPEHYLPKPYVPDARTPEEIQQKQKEKLGLVDYNYMPTISSKSRRLAEKRRMQMGMSNLNVEDVLIQEDRIKTTQKEKLKHNTSVLGSTSLDKSKKKTSKRQADLFYSRQQKYKDKVDNKISKQRDATKKEEQIFSGIPTINKTSKSMKRSYTDLMAWKSNAQTKVKNQRYCKEREELVSLKTYRSSISSNL